MFTEWEKICDLLVKSHQYSETCDKYEMRLQVSFKLKNIKR